MGNRKWSKEKIIERILELDANNEELSLSYNQKNRRPLFKAAKYYFGSWKNAIESTGVDYNNVNKYANREVWSRKKIIKRIQKLLKSGEKPSSRYVQNHYPKLFAAATSKKYFGSWKKAVIASEINYEEVCKFETWSKNKILKEIRRINKLEKGKMYTSVKSTV